LQVTFPNNHPFGMGLSTRASRLYCTNVAKTILFAW